MGLSGTYRIHLHYVAAYGGDRPDTAGRLELHPISRNCYLAFNMYKAMENGLLSSVSANKSLLGYPNVSAFDAVVGRLILQIGTATVVAVVIIGEVMAVLRHPPSIE